MNVRNRCIFSVSVILSAAIGPALAGQARASATARPPAAPRGKYARFRLVLAEAGEKGDPLVAELHARDGRLSTGWAHVTTDAGFIRSHGLHREGHSLRGRLCVAVGPLQYNCELSARISGNRLLGSYTGRRGIAGAVDGLTRKVTGRLSPLAEGGNLRVELRLWSMYTQHGHIRRPHVVCTVRDGRVREGTFAFGRKPENRGKLEGGRLKVTNGRLIGTVDATVLAGDAAHGTYHFRIDVPVRNNFVRGTYATTKDGKDWGRHGFTGEVRGLGRPGDGGVLVVGLAGGIRGESPLTLYLARKGDGFTGGMARGGNQAMHEVDASQLRMTGGTVNGPVSVTVLPQGDYPPGGRPVKCRYTLNARLDDGQVTGTFSGRYGIQQSLRGALTGGILTPRQIGSQLSPAASAEAVRIGWPSLAGPFGTFLPAQSNVRIVDDASKATIAWVSENADLGIGKQGTPFGKSFRFGSRIGRYLGPGAGRHPGNWAGAIVADGKVFAASFRPTGPYRECDFPDGVAAKVRVDAEDILVCMDFHTGHTRWLAAEKGGILTGGGKRAGFQVAPVYRDGKVFAMGSTGRLFAYDAETGRKLWQSDIGEAHRRLARQREQVLASLAKRRFAYPRSPAWHTSLTVAEDTLVAGTFSKGTLRGLDVRTGKMRWEAPGAGSHLATPSVWCHGNREYILTANTTGQMRLVDPRDGKELWQVDGLGGSFFTLSPSPTHVLVNVNPDSGKHPGGRRVPGYFGAYRITPQKAQLAWKMPFEPRNGIACWMDSEARYRYTMRNGLAYLYTDGHGRDVPGRFLVLRQHDGKVLAQHVNKGGEADKIGGLWYLVGDKVLTRWNDCHGPRHGGRHPWKLWRIHNGEIRRLPGSLDKNEFTNAYEVTMEHPLVAGRLLERSEDGRIVCYDLRAK